MLGLGVSRSVVLKSSSVKVESMVEQSSGTETDGVKLVMTEAKVVAWLKGFSRILTAKRGIVEIFEAQSMGQDLIWPKSFHNSSF